MNSGPKKHDQKNQNKTEIQKNSDPKKTRQLKDSDSKTRTRKNSDRRAHDIMYNCKYV